MVSAAIMAAVLEERQKEQRHCPTCTCSPHGGSPHTSSSMGSRPTGGAGGRGGLNNSGPGASTEFFHTNETQKYGKGFSSDVPSGQLNGVHAGKRPSVGEQFSLTDLDTDQFSSLSFCVNNNGDSEESSLLCVDNSVNSNYSNDSKTNDYSAPVTASLIDLLPDECAKSEGKNSSRDRFSIVDLNSLSITEHFNSENLTNLTVDKCICGRPYAAGSNVIDVGTQTVPSYIGESGKVHSTCIYCKGHKIKDRHRDKAKESKSQKHQKKSCDVGCVSAEESVAQSCSTTNQLSRSCSDGESVSLVSESSYGGGDMQLSSSSNNNNVSITSDTISSCSNSSIPSINCVNTATNNSTEKIESPTAASSSSAAAAGGRTSCSPWSAHSWEWQTRTHKSSQVII